MPIMCRHGEVYGKVSHTTLYMKVADNCQIGWLLACLYLRVGIASVSAPYPAGPVPKFRHFRNFDECTQKQTKKTDLKFPKMCTNVEYCDSPLHECNTPLHNQF